ncbi:transketolase [Candidatus Kaiserbacteria bacterium RIFCSPHIGHO2_01_FULL_46_22]|uniref:Transketolase n=1 Tax=Candidatus Kaiserbacteria bacterium RIFCSPHIGHO2_01_FULL_46_22 TaxID=1798475 RepID=A0A1F6BY30_9BACT|nr:MAG: transketolase [Candidatus Kaiserbacteria bacterium RIFCSPHIGHO2_01_FULL_46_22]
MKIASHLNPKLFDEGIEKAPTRDGFGEGLREAGEKDPKVVALSADLVESTRANLFADAFPDRFIEVGVAEQNMASVASGLAAVGKIPFITSYAMFSPGRNWEQIRTTIAYNERNVKIIGAHSGISVGPDGATHQALEDMAIMRAMPNMIVIAPVDAVEAKKATLWASTYDGPVYIRLGREKVPTVTTIGTPFQLGQGGLWIEKDDDLPHTVGVITTGSMFHSAASAAVELEKKGIGISILHLPMVKPLDTAGVLKLAESHDIIVTVEEHQRNGGLGGAVAELLGEERPTKVIRLGIDDQFGQTGEPEELLKHYGLDKNGIINKITEVFGV